MFVGKTKTKPPARVRAPSHPPGETVRIDINLDADARERTFRAIRRLLPPGRWTRVVIDRRGVVVQGLRPFDVAPICRTLDLIARDLAPRPVRRRDLVA